MTQTDSTTDVTVYTDGASLGNPGPGGYAAVLLHVRHRREISGGFRLSTNNRMEIFAAITALETLKMPCRVTLYSDSAYLVNAMLTGTARRWRSNGWHLTSSGNKPVKNADLWQRLLEACDGHQVSFQKVKGHANVLENERCDQLAVEAANDRPCQADTDFERLNPDLTAPPQTDRQPVINPNQKVTSEGQPCRKCGQPVIKRQPRKPRGQSYTYAYYLYCPQCRTIYMVEAAKRFPNRGPGPEAAGAP